MMLKRQRNPEIEVKLRAPDLAAIRKRLRQLRARQISPRTHESNTLYDTPRKDLRRRRQLLRIRVEAAPAKPGKGPVRNSERGVLTYKAPFRSNSQADDWKSFAAKHRRFKIREEAELALTKAEEMNRILQALGLQPVFRYEKFRTTYALPGIPSLKIELDETPIGNYIELEGTTAGIEQAARLLGYTRRDYITDTYGALYLAECRRRGRKPGDMTFPASKKLHGSALFP